MYALGRADGIYAKGTGWKNEIGRFAGEIPAVHLLTALRSEAHALHQQEAPAASGDNGPQVASLPVPTSIRYGAT